MIEEMIGFLVASGISLFFIFSGMFFIRIIRSGGVKEIEIRNFASCPNCSSDLIPRINESQKRNPMSLRIFVSCDCGEKSHWDTAGTPPILVGSINKNKPGGTSESTFKKKYGN